MMGRLLNMLSIGSIVRLKDGSQDLMILNRAPLIEEGDETVWYDYSACKYPIGLDVNQVFYFNEENISKVVFEGYINDSEERFRKFFQQWIEEQGTSIPKGKITGPLGLFAHVLTLYIFESRPIFKIRHLGQG